MRRYPVVAIAFFVLSLIGSSEVALADCCHTSCGWVCFGRTCEPTVCSDCTAGTPYCGYGSCNIFGCNCDGGCRTGDCSGSGGGNCLGSCSDCSINPVASQPQDPVANFKAIDADGSGALSLQEVRAWAEKNRSDLTHSDGVFKAAFKAIDKNGSGNIELEEYDPDVAASQKQAEGKKKN